MTCTCQLVLTAEDTESLIAPVKVHFDEAHPDLGISEPSVRNYLEGEDRLTGPTDRLDEIGEVEVRTIDAVAAEDIARFFDFEVYAGNPAWSACYCMYFLRGGSANASWGDEPWQQNRADLLARIGEGTVTGALAYVDGKLAGWCNATARAEFPGLGDGDDTGIASVVCFAVAPPYRRHGIASKMLDQVVSSFREQGFRSLEAYPVRDPADERAAFHGSLDLYERFGFEVTSEHPLTVGLELG